ncbi:hypothetical protein CUMW_165400, partial [Citrus unshiu]
YFILLKTLAPRLSRAQASETSHHPSSRAVFVPTTLDHSRRFRRRRRPHPQRRTNRSLSTFIDFDSRNLGISSITHLKN